MKTLITGAAILLGCVVASMIAITGLQLLWKGIRRLWQKIFGPQPAANQPAANQPVATPTPIPPAPVPGPTPVRTPWRKSQRKRVPAPVPVTVELPADLPGLDEPHRRYVEWCRSRLEEAAREVERKRVAEQDRVEALAEKLTRDVQRHADAEGRLAELRELRERRLHEAEADWDALVALGAVARVETTAYGWCVVTTPLRFMAGTASHELGKVELHLGLGGEYRVLNQDHRIERTPDWWDHPRVRNGVPILDAASRVRIARALAGRRLREATSLLLTFLTADCEFCALIPAAAWPSVTEVTHGQGMELKRIIP